MKGHLMKTEPVILASLARVLAAGIVGLGAKYGLKLDLVEVVGLIVAAEMAAATWVRARVSPVKA
jgi:hypothetical protein